MNKLFSLLLFVLAFGARAEDKISAVAIVGHGLNNRFVAMQPVVDTLKEWNIEVVPLVLAGHEDGDGEKGMPRVSAEDWQKNFADAYKIARAKADEKKVPLYYVAYSLTSIVGLRALQDSSIHFDKMVLLAPPLVTKEMTHLVQAIPVGGVNIPSLMPPESRAHKGTSVSAYKSLFVVQRAVKLTPEIAAVPTLVLIDPKDELVNASGTIKRVQKDAPNWQVETLAAERPNGYGFHHLLVDPRCMGDREWGHLRDSVKSFLQPAVVPSTVIIH